VSARIAAWLAVFALAAPGAARGASPELPDLTATAEDFSLELDQNVPIGDVAELCASAATGVDLIRFDSTTHNVGEADLVIGDPDCPSCAANPGAQCGNPNFHCSPAGGHNHAHFSNYARYELLQEGVVVRTGGKFGFCLEDTFCGVGASEKFTCEFQGLTAGCEDLYVKFLGCQYIDVTGLPSGDYTVRVTVDPMGLIPESDETNNSSEYPVQIAGTEEPDVAMPGTSLEVKTRPGGGRRLALLARPAVLPFQLPSPPVAPTVVGASLTVNDVGGGGPVTVELPAARWKALGRPPGERGYRYNGGPGDACASVRLTPDKVKARCRLDAFALPATGSGVSIELFVGEDLKRYCTLFGGAEQQNDAKKLRRSGAPEACQEN
jgi:hypothetical protein